MKRRWTIAMAVCAVSSMVATMLPSPAFADTTPPEEAFRTSLTTYIQNLQGALNAAAQNSQTKAAISPKLQDEQTAIAVANQQIPLLTGPQLDAMQGILGQNTAWQQQPAVVQQALSNVKSAGPSLQPPPGFLSDCTANVGDPRGLFYGYWAAAQVASAAAAVASGLPDGADFTPALIIAGVAYGVANGIAIVLAANLSLSQDCATAVANAALAATYPTDPSSTNPGNVTPASSQISVNTLTVLSQGIQTTLNTIQTTINTITLTLQGVINSLGTAQGTANAIQATAIDLQSRTDALLSTIGTATDQATDPGVGGAPPTGTANGLANTINTREDTTLANTAAFQALSLRAEIEAALAPPSQGPIELFELPAAKGGKLETVQSIVVTTITNELAAHQTIGQAQAKLAAGNTAMAAGQYQTAYADFEAAYMQAVG